MLRRPPLPHPALTTRTHEHERGTSTPAVPTIPVRGRAWLDAPPLAAPGLGRCASSGFLWARLAALGVWAALGGSRHSEPQRRGHRSGPAAASCARASLLPQTADPTGKHIAWPLTDRWYIACTPLVHCWYSSLVHTAFAAQVRCQGDPGARQDAPGRRAARAPRLRPLRRSRRSRRSVPRSRSAR